MSRRYLVLALLLCAPGVPAAPPAKPAAAPAPVEFESYQLVLLKRGPRAQELTEAQLKELQPQHLAHLKKMGESGKMLVAGPFSDQPDESMRGMCIYRASSLAEAKELAEADPAVKAGRLKVEVMTWHTEKGAVTFPRAVAK